MNCVHSRGGACFGPVRPRADASAPETASGRQPEGTRASSELALLRPDRGGPGPGACSRDIYTRRRRSCGMTTGRTTGVWISAASATILEWGPDGVTIRERIDSLVPGRHRSTGRPPTEDHPAGEGHRDEHMRTFFAQISARVPIDDDLLLIGDGEVVEHFAHQIEAQDRSRNFTRRVEMEKSGPMTEPQLLARIRAFAGAPAKRTLPS